jgi:hypothetical protein
MEKNEKKAYVKPTFEYWPTEVLDRIEAQMSGGSGSTGSNPSGTSINPYVLAPGQKMTVTAAGCWFKCTVAGATHFEITSASNATVAIFNTFSFLPPVYSNISTKSVSETLLDKSENSGSNTYYVRVFPTSVPTPVVQISCTVKQHVDVSYSTTPIFWIPDENSPVANLNFLYSRYCYAPSDVVSNLELVIRSDNFLALMEIVGDATLLISSIASGYGVSGLAARLLAWMFAGFATVDIFNTTNGLFNFKQMFIEKIGAVAEETDPSEWTTTDTGLIVKHYHKGAYMVKYRSNGLLLYDIKSWVLGDVSGAGGWIGRFRAPEDATDWFDW